MFTLYAPNQRPRLIVTDERCESVHLIQAGFKHIQVKQTFGYWSIVTGVKP
jgi:hypothetical protein